MKHDRTPINQKFVVRKGHQDRIYAERDARPFATLPNNALLNSDDICELFGCSMRTLYRWIADHDFPYWRKIGREYLFLKNEILAWDRQTRPQRGRPYD